MSTPTSNSFADLDPSLLSMPGMSEFTPDASHDDMLKAGLQAAMPFRQFETLAVDPSLSKEAQAEQDEKFFRAVGEVSLAAETLNYDDLKIQVQTEKARAAQHFAAEQQQAMDVMDPFGTKAKKEDDEKRSSEARYAVAA